MREENAQILVTVNINYQTDNFQKRSGGYQLACGAQAYQEGVSPGLRVLGSPPAQGALEPLPSALQVRAQPAPAKGRGSGFFH